MALTVRTRCDGKFSFKASKCLLGISLGLLGSLIASNVNAEVPSKDQEKAKARQVISVCWSDYEKKSLDPGTKRFVASTCEKLERDFVQKFGHRP